MLNSGPFAVQPAGISSMVPGLASIRNCLVVKFKNKHCICTEAWLMMSHLLFVNQVTLDKYTHRAMGENFSLFIQIESKDTRNASDLILHYFTTEISSSI